MISIIIPSMQLTRDRNLWRFFAPSFSIEDTIRSVVENVRGVRYEVIVVCNGLQDQDLVTFVKGSAHITKYCLNSVNVGVSRAWNMGANMAEGETLCFLNDDVEVGEGCLEALCEVLNSDEKVGEVGPNGGKWDRLASGERVGLERVEEAEEISGYLFMLKRHVFEEIGGFDIGYTPAGFEDIDTSFAVRAHGYRCLVVPGLKVKHYGRMHGVSARVMTIKYLSTEVTTEELYARNSARFLKKWYPQG